MICLFRRHRGVVIYLHPTFSLFGVTYITFPFVIFLALVTCLFTYLLTRKYNQFYSVTVVRFCFPILICAGIGARLLSAITLCTVTDYSFSYLLINGGSVFYGGVIGGIAGLLIVCAVKRYEFLAFSDVYVTVLPIGHAIGRLGCYLNGCCYGSPYTGPGAVRYIVNGIETTVFPTWFIEAGFCLLLFLYFQLIHKNNATGVRTAIYFIGYSIYRFLIEFMRGDDIRGHFGLLSSSQIISIFMFLIGFSILYGSLQKNRDNYLFKIQEGES